MMICENWIEHIASELNKDPLEIRMINLYKKDNYRNLLMRVKFSKININLKWYTY